MSLVSRLFRRSPSSPHDDALCRVARETFGWERLQPAQLDAMRHLMDGNDVLVVMPTGAGKSAIYQIPAMLLDGPTVVVSPLVALQADQIANLRKAGAPRAAAINSARSKRDIDAAWAALAAGELEYVFLSPEQLAKADVLDRLRAAKPSLFVVDEAHCVSAWGHDFRPDYARLREAVTKLGHPPVVALTATAAPPVRADIVELLGLREHIEVITGFDRPNLLLEVRRFVEPRERLAALLDVATEHESPGLVYTPTRRESERIAERLRAAGKRAAAYHAGMRAADRHEVHEAFLRGETEIVVATSAFGLGIDKPDVRFVLHSAMPESLDTYYQEIGRAGRDGGPSSAILFYRQEDTALSTLHAMRRADDEVTVAIVELLGSGAKPPSRAALAELLDVSTAKATRALNALELAGVATLKRGKIHLRQSDPDAVVAAVREAMERQELLERSRVSMMRGYAETLGCRRQFLLGYFGEELVEPCGDCDTCVSGLADAAAEADDEFAVNTKVRHAEWGAGVVMRAESDRLTVLFEQVGYRQLSLAAVRRGGLLRPVAA